MPDSDERRALWAAHLPARAPVDAGVDLDQLAAFYPISGALIRNAAIGAAYLAAAVGQPIRTEHIVHAVRREYLKAGLAYPGPLPDDTGPAKEQPCQ
jgi:putative alpha-1,2-mannosidase